MFVIFDRKSENTHEKICIMNILLIPFTYSNKKNSIRSVSIRKILLNTFLSICFLLTLSGCTGEAQYTCKWPCFHGSDRTNKSTETGLLKKWPEGGPELLWTVSGLGEGFTSVSIGGGLLYTAGMTDNQTYVFVYDYNGKLVWKKPNGKSWSTRMSHASSYIGPRSTPTYDNSMLYHLGDMGRLTAFDSKTGEEIWYRELPQDFDAEPTEYGYSESVLIDGDKLYTRPAGKKGFQVCLNKHNGELIWANTEIPGVEGYTSMVLMDFGGYRQIIGSSSDCYYGVDTKTGKLLWKVDYRNSQGLNVTDVIVNNEYVFISSGYGKGSMLLKLKGSGEEIIPETVWHSELMDNHHGGVILHNDYLYGSGTNSRGWFCLDFLTGKQIWKIQRGKGSLTYADGMLYMLDERGTIKLVKATPDKYELSGEFNVPEGGPGMYWAHPVVCGGRLYIRHADKLYAYDISEE
jgi:outer membrane protein assembly factor BamB